MKTLILAMAAVLLGACATQQPIQSFRPVSLSPVSNAVTRTQQHIAAGQTAAQKLADECAQKSAGWQSAYQQLNDELTQAYLSAKIAQDAVKDKTEEIVAQTNDANKVVAERNKAVAQVTVQTQRAHRWMKYSAVEGLLLLGALAWMTKGIWLKALVALMLMVSVAQANIGDTEAQWRARIKNSTFQVAPLDVKQVHGHMIMATNEHFYCLVWIVNEKVVVESFIKSNDREFTIADFTARLSDYGEPGTFIPMGRDENGVIKAMNSAATVYIYYGPMKGMDAQHVLTIVDKDFNDNIIAHAAFEQARYVAPALPDGDEDEQPANSIPRA